MKTPTDFQKTFVEFSYENLVCNGYVLILAKHALQLHSWYVEQCLLSKYDLYHCFRVLFILCYQVELALPISFESFEPQHLLTELGNLVDTAMMSDTASYKQALIIMFQALVYICEKEGVNIQELLEEEPPPIKQESFTLTRGN